MKRTALVLLLFLFIVGNFLLLASPVVNGGVKLSPAKLIITMPEGYPEEEIQYKIKVTNPYSQDIEASSKAINPWDITENYARIPDLSWVKILPEKLTIPADSFKEFEVVIDIPESEKMPHYNESWEVWVLVIPKGPADRVKGGAVIQTQLAARLFIHTPGTMKKQTPQNNLYLIVGIIIGFILIVAAVFYARKRRNIEADRAAIYYVKKKNKKLNKR